VTDPAPSAAPGPGFDYRLFIPFRREAQVASRRTPERKRVRNVAFIGFAIAVVLSWTVYPGNWLWIYVLVDFVVFTVLGNVWANMDALDDDERRNHPDFQPEPDA
jgi:hypothetical protein